MLVSSGLSSPNGVAVDGSGNVYIADSRNCFLEELPRAFVAPTAKSEATAAGTDALPVALPTTTSLTGPFAPKSDQSWLTIGSISGGVVHFSFSANTWRARTAHISLLGQSITVTQAAKPAPTASVTKAAPTINVSTGGTSTTTITITLRRRREPPSISSTFGTSNITVNHGATVTGETASGDAVTYTIKSPAATWAASLQGAYTVSLASTVKDRAGDSIAADSNFSTFTIDTVSPTLTSINRSSPAGQFTNLTSVTFLATFSEAVTGVNTNVAADFALTGTAIAGGKIGTPTTSNGGLTWSIPVTGLSSTANGTVQLNLTHNTGIKDLAGERAGHDARSAARPTRWTIPPPR